MIDSTNIRVKVSRKYLDTFIEIELSDTLANTGDTQATVDMFFGVIASQFGRIEAEHLPSLGWGKGSTPSQAEESALVDFVPEKLVKEVQNGKVYYKLVGGQFSQFGVRVWEEVLKPTGMIEALGTKFLLVLKPDWRASVQTVGGKKKIVKLVRDAK